MSIKGFLSSFLGNGHEFLRSNDIKVQAAPGLITILDTALYQTHEGQLTSTMSSANSLLHTFFHLRMCAHQLLDSICHTQLWTHQATPCDATADHLGQQLVALEKFAKFCIESSDDVIYYITTDKLASTANLPFQETSSTPSIDGDITEGIIASANNMWEEICSRIDPSLQHALKEKDCWESTKLYCPDYVWADDVHVYCNELLKNMMRHDSLNICNDISSNELISKDQIILENFEDTVGLLTKDLPLRLAQFRNGLEHDSIVTKRLYLVKNEYRAPFRAFLEGHTLLQRAPDLRLVESYIKLHQVNDTASLKTRRQHINQKKQDLILNKSLMKIMEMEEQTELLEVKMAKMLCSFCELARVLTEAKPDAKVLELSKKSSSVEVGMINEVRRRLSTLLSRKAGRGLSTGIRPLLLDLQGSERVSGLTTCNALCGLLREDKSRNHAEHFADTLDTILRKISDNITLLSLMQSCKEWNRNEFVISFNEWITISKQQQQLCLSMNGNGQNVESLIEDLRLTEIYSSIANATFPSLMMVQQKISRIAEDLTKRFDILKDMVEECCLREMNLKIDIQSPKREVVLHLPMDYDAIPGVFDVFLNMAGIA